ncbi:hypothetical protein [Psychrobacter sp. Ps6]|uniref:hypothetical protein n=1 Tax=Psychrobacter sp. Ps6 TaxID=2790960 RepID=UPI001EDFD088|nr:hypothetical protein [Psychrobacter sp. Ps6]MCG3878308.1 hypothetical protein [Psychrobacter sp. Ps6]
MKEIRSVVGFFSDLADKLKDLVSVTEPSNYKTLLDVSAKLYDDEVSRYRFLEEKSSRILTLISFLLPSTSTILYWIYSNSSNLFNPYVVLSIFLALCSILTSLFFVLATYSMSERPVLEISDGNIEEAGNKNFNTIYLNFLQAYRRSISQYRLVNGKKAKSLDYAYKFLIAYFAASFIMAVFLAISFIFTN